MLFENSNFDPSVYGPCHEFSREAPNTVKDNLKLNFKK